MVRPLLLSCVTIITIAAVSGCSGTSGEDDSSAPSAAEAVSAPAPTLVGTMTIQRTDGGPVETRNVTYVPSGSTPQSYLDEQEQHGAGSGFAIQSSYKHLDKVQPSLVGYGTHEKHRASWDTGSIVQVDAKQNLTRVKGSVSTWNVYSRFNKFLRTETYPKVTFDLTVAQ